jgi:outer membrane protein OmpA-like peptidoglycan-associated protein
LEESIMRKSILVLSLSAVTLAVAPACATKKFVQQEVGQVNEKVTTLGSSLEETQERVRQNEQRIGDVDQRAQSAARGAQQAADDARRYAGQVGEEASARAAAIEAEQRKLLFEVVLSEDQGRFAFGAADVPDEAKAAIDQMVDSIKADAQSVWIEIEGHTDSVGNASFNEQLGLRRAEAVKRYLYEKHQVPLHKMNVISYGQDRPVAPNNTREGRALNRRVVIKVLS